MTALTICTTYWGNLKEDVLSSICVFDLMSWLPDVTVSQVNVYCGWWNCFWCWVYKSSVHASLMQFKPLHIALGCIINRGLTVIVTLFRTTKILPGPFEVRSVWSQVIKFITCLWTAHFHYFVMIEFKIN